MTLLTDPNRKQAFIRSETRRKILYLMRELHKCAWVTPTCKNFSEEEQEYLKKIYTASACAMDFLIASEHKRS